MQHYLLTIPCGHLNVHGYLMCRGHDRKIVEDALNRMMDRRNLASGHSPRAS
jgi:hypothetical protein